MFSVVLSAREGLSDLRSASGLALPAVFGLVSAHLQCVGVRPCSSACGLIWELLRLSGALPHFFGLRVYLGASARCRTPCSSSSACGLLISGLLRVVGRFAPVLRLMGFFSGPLRPLSAYPARCPFSSLCGGVLAVYVGATRSVGFRACFGLFFGCRSEDGSCAAEGSGSLRVGCFRASERRRRLAEGCGMPSVPENP